MAVTPGNANTGKWKLSWDKNGYIMQIAAKNFNGNCKVVGEDGNVEDR